MNLKSVLEEQILILDGAMGTCLQEVLRPGENPSFLNMTDPESVKGVYTRYLEAGSRVILTNTFSANAHKLGGAYTPEEVIARAVGLAREAVGDRDALVALDVGPIGELLHPNGSLTFEEAYGLFAAQIRAGAAAGADLIFIETMTDLLEAKCAVLAAKENCHLPVFCTMSFEKGGRTFLGDSIAAMAVTLQTLGVDALGINCSLGPAEMLPMLAELKKWTDLPLILKPNAGLPRVGADGKAVHMSPADFCAEVERLAEAGAAIVGGCCGTSPEYIALLSERLTGKAPVQEERKAFDGVCSAYFTADAEEVSAAPRLLEEREYHGRISGDELEEIIDRAMDLAADGAAALIVNVDQPGLVQAESAAKIYEELSQMVRVPLVLRSSCPEAVKGLRTYKGVSGLIVKEENSPLCDLARKQGIRVLIG